MALNSVMAVIFVVEIAFVVSYIFYYSFVAVNKIISVEIEVHKTLFADLVFELDIAVDYLCAFISICNGDTIIFSSVLYNQLVPPLFKKLLHQDYSRTHHKKTVLLRNDFQVELYSRQKAQ